MEEDSTHPEDLFWANGGEVCATCGCLNCKHDMFQKVKLDTRRQE